MVTWMISWFYRKPLNEILSVAHSLHADLVEFETRMDNLISRKNIQQDVLQAEITLHTAEKATATNVKTFIEGLIKVV